ncbi:nitroreductase family protein [Ktedonospora formicarum]|uniref:NADH dehydrogenase n=1 Tax=Ktedonospora formicarum TaxID=2778364 RepID=A0A8J3I3N1_9CHLR|nr:nitroreductase family protein [Ktedonospora formicarum]GHO48171.1 NADH dehydrogenase [Ktedonospora formicarum]
MPDIQKPAHVAELIRTQRATRQYSQREVPEEDIRTILNAGRRAQSSRNLQRWYFIVVRDRERLRRLAEGGKYAEHVRDAAFAIALVTSDGGSAEFDLGQAAAYLQLAAWDLGIGSCVTSMHYPEKAREALGVPADQNLNVVLSFGYPAPRENVQPPKKNGRKPFDEVVRWESWS